MPPSSLEMCISIQAGSIRYFIRSHNNGQVLFFGNYQLHHVEGEADLVERVQKIYLNDEALQLAYYKVFIAIDTPYNVVPGTGEVISSGLNITLQQPIPALGLCLQFSIAPVLQSKLRSLYPASIIEHLNKACLQFLPGYGTDKLFVNVHHDYLDVIRFSLNGPLQLMNRYEFKTQNDFIYFLLLCCTQLQIDRESTSLVLMGEVDPDSEIYKSCYKYFRHLTFITPPEGVQFGNGFENYPRHLHFNLYTLGL